MRLHRQGEGAAYTGLKPAGLGEAPVVPKVEEAIEYENPDDMIEFLQHAVKDEIEKMFQYVMATKNYEEKDVDSARRYAEAMRGITLYSHHLYEFIRKSDEHGAERTGQHKVESKEHYH